MPVSILTPTQRRQYGRFVETPSAEQIAKHCFLSPQEIAKVVARRPQSWQQMGFAVQLMTVRFLGTFLDRREVINVPQILVAFAAQQLHLRDIPNLSSYKKAIDLIGAHRDSIREQFGYSNFADATTDYEHWLKARVLRAGDTLLELFDLSTAWCVERKVLLPAATTLERTMAPKRATFASVHDATLHGLWVELAEIAQHEKRDDSLLALLNVSPETGRTQIDELQRAPTRQSTNGMQESEQRVKRFKQIGVSDLRLDRFPAARIQQMADYAVLSKSSQLMALQSARKLATLLAFATLYEIIAVDDGPEAPPKRGVPGHFLIDLFDVLMSQLMSRSKSDAGRKRLEGIAELDVAALLPPAAGGPWLWLVRLL